MNVSRFALILTCLLAPVFSAKSLAAEPIDFNLRPAVVGQFLFLRFQDSSGSLNLDLTREGEATDDDILIDEYTRTSEGVRGAEGIHVLDATEFVGFFLLKRAQARIAENRLADAQIDLEPLCA